MDMAHYILKTDQLYIKANGLMINIMEWVNLIIIVIILTILINYSRICYSNMTVTILNIIQIIGKLMLGNSSVDHFMDSVHLHSLMETLFMEPSKMIKYMEKEHLLKIMVKML